MQPTGNTPAVDLTKAMFNPPENSDVAELALDLADSISSASADSFTQIETLIKDNANQSMKGFQQTVKVLTRSLHKVSTPEADSLKSLLAKVATVKPQEKLTAAAGVSPQPKSSKGAIAAGGKSSLSPTAMAKPTGTTASSIGAASGPENRSSGALVSKRGNVFEKAAAFSNAARPNEQKTAKDQKGADVGFAGKSVNVSPGSASVATNSAAGTRAKSQPGRLNISGAMASKFSRAANALGQSAGAGTDAAVQDRLKNLVANAKATANLVASMDAAIGSVDDVTMRRALNTAGAPAGQAASAPSAGSAANATATPASNAPSEPAPTAAPQVSTPLASISETPTRESSVPVGDREREEFRTTVEERLRFILGDIKQGLAPFKAKVLGGFDNLSKADQELCEEQCFYFYAAKLCASLAKTMNEDIFSAASDIDYFKYRTTLGDPSNPDKVTVDQHDLDLESSKAMQNAVAVAQEKLEELSSENRKKLFPLLSNMEEALGSLEANVRVNNQGIDRVIEQTLNLKHNLDADLIKRFFGENEGLAILQQLGKDAQESNKYAYLVGAYIGGTLSNLGESERNYNDFKGMAGQSPSDAPAKK